jgi:small-conductance mechanosensitive channel
MTGNRFYFNSQRGEARPARSWFGYLVMLPVITAALVLGFFFFAAFLAFFSIVVMVFMVRFWWMRRRLRKGAAPRAARTAQRESGAALDGEYVVITEEKRETGK